MSRGLGQAALAIGSWYDLYRPAGVDRPLGEERRVMRLLCAVSAGGPGFKRQAVPGKAEWYGVFDTAYARVGDYLVGAEGRFFVAAMAAMAALVPPLLVRCDRVVDVKRPDTGVATGLLGYGGEGRGTLAPVLRGWPASVLAGRVSGVGGLPGDGRGAMWTVWLPVLPTHLRAGDLMEDEGGVRFVVAAAEVSGLGWRVMARQAGV